MWTRPPSSRERRPTAREETTVRTSDGSETRVPTGTGFGTLSAGGLY
jgi:hypothetical protein